MAMQIDMILDQLARKLRIEDLWKLRPTCRQWNRSFVGAMQDRGGDVDGADDTSGGPTVKLAPKPPEPRSSATFHVSQGQAGAGVQMSHPSAHTMQDHTNLMRSSLHQPFTTYKIYDLHRRQFLLHQHFKEFFLVCGKSIKHLNLHCQMSWMDDMNLDRIREALFELTPQLTHLNLILDANRRMGLQNNRNISSPLTVPPTLHKLQILCVKLVNGFHKSIQILLADIVKCTPNLNCFVVEISSSQTTSELLSTLGSLMPQLNNLTALRLPDMKIQELRGLLPLGSKFRLQNLVISIVRGQDDHQEISDLCYQFLATQATTLQAFYMSVGHKDLDRRDGVLIPLRIPLLQRLQTFGFRRLGIGDLLVHYDGGTLAINFPQLKRFEYNFYATSPDSVVPTNWQAAVFDDLSKMSHDGVTELVLDVSQLDSKAEIDMDLFGERFPSIKKLDFGFKSLISKTPSKIWTAWPKLISLHVRYEKSIYTGANQLDELLTGLPACCLDLGVDWLWSELQSGDSQAEMQAQAMSLAERLHAIQHAHKDIKWLPALSDLKELQEFSLVVTASENDVRGSSASVNEKLMSSLKSTLTDVGGYLGLAMANPGLQRMNVQLHRSRRLPSSDLTWPANSSLSVEETQKSGQLFTPECKKLIKSAFHPNASIDIQD